MERKKPYLPRHSGSYGRTMDDVERKQIKEHIQTLEWVKEELEIQKNDLVTRIQQLYRRIEIEKEKLK